LLLLESVVAPEEEDEDKIDENDPLWIATLHVTNGDRERALKLLEDPDALMQYPEIRKIMESMDDGEEGEGEREVSAAPAAAASSSGALEDWESTEVREECAEPANTTASSSSAAAAAAEDDGAATPVPKDGATAAADDTSLLAEGDAREHLNLVFIGHVDAGKSTLSGSILYIMGKVDKRTIERYEKEAKDRNRESWFLAFILDTSEEERSKGITVEVGRAHFETEKKRYTILDAPGHKNYVPNMVCLTHLLTFINLCLSDVVLAT